MSFIHFSEHFHTEKRLNAHGFLKKKNKYSIGDNARKDAQYWKPWAQDSLIKIEYLVPGRVCYSDLPGLLFYDALHLSGVGGLGLLPFVLVPLKRINITFTGLLDTK